MGYERYPRDENRQDQGRDYGSGRDYTYSSARDYGAAGQSGDRDRQGYGSRDDHDQRYAQRDRYQGGSGGRDYYGGQGGSDRDAYANRNQDRSGGYAAQSGDRYGQAGRYGADAGREYHGSYGSGSRRFEDFGSHTHADDDNYRGNRDRQQSPQNRSQAQQGYGRQPQGYEYDDRGFFARAGDEVRSWFGDEDAERRREYDSRMDERHANDRDDDYHSWRRGQIQSLDRDYDEYRRENRSKFENEFGSWRSNRQTQRDSLNAVEEHMDVVGSDGEHVGTVDKVRGDRILLTKTDVDAGGRHHSIPSNWLQSVDGKVTLSKTAADAKKAWRDEERNQAMFGEDGSDRNRYAQGGAASDATTTKTGTTASSTATSGAASATGLTGGATAGDEGKTLNRSFSGTY